MTQQANTARDWDETKFTELRKAFNKASGINDPDDCWIGMNNERVRSYTQGGHADSCFSDQGHVKLHGHVYEYKDNKPKRTDVMFTMRIFADGSHVVEPVE